MSRHAGKVAWLRPRRPTPPMRPGDSVAPRVSRRGSLIALSVAVFVIAVLSGVGLSSVYRTAVDAQRDATGSRTFTQDELQQITTHMDARRRSRDREQATRDAVLCTVLATLAREGAGNRDTLTDAARDLDCPDLPQPRPAATTSSSTSASTSSSSERAGSGGSSSSAPTAPAPRPAPEPSTPAAQSPRLPTDPATPPPAAPGPLEPVTDGLCNLVGLCL